MHHDIAREVEKLADDLGIDRKRSIGDIAKELKVETHIIRFWEEKFPQIKPEIGAGKRRYYYNKQLKILKRIKKFLYEDGYTISGLQKLLKKRKADNYRDEDLDIIVSEAAPAMNNVCNINSANDNNSLANTLARTPIDGNERDEIERLLAHSNGSLNKLKVALQKSIL